jgi:hypothetical protein
MKKLSQVLRHPIAKKKIVNLPPATEDVSQDSDSIIELDLTSKMIKVERKN